MRRFSKKLITYPLLILAGLILLFEEALWTISGLLALLTLLGRLPIFRSIEDGIRRAPRWGALALFGVPSVALAPIKFMALYWAAGGHPVLGIGTIIAAKVMGTAIVARLFQLTRPQLLSFGWFRCSFEKIMAVRAAAYGIWLDSAAGRMWRRFRERNRGWVRRRWDAVRAKSRARRPRES